MAQKKAEYLCAKVSELFDAETADALIRAWSDLSDLRSQRRSASRTSSQPPRSARGFPELTARQHRKESLFALLDGGSGPVLVEHLDLEGRFRLGSELTDNTVPTYVQRTADIKLRARIASALGAGPDEWRARIVLAAGPPKAGKTRSILEAVTDLAPHALALVKRPGVSIADLAEALLRAQDFKMYDDPIAIVIVEDLHLLLGRGANVERELRRLLEGPRHESQRIVLAGTIHDDYLTMTDIRASLQGISPSDRDLLQSVAICYSLDLDPTEEQDAAEIFADLLASGDLKAEDLHELAATMSAIGALNQRVEETMTKPGPTATDSLERAARDAVLRAALDAAIIERGGVSTAALKLLADNWFASRNPTRGYLNEQLYVSALNWATEPVGSAWALLNPTQGAEPAGDRWKLLDAILAKQIGRYEPPPWLNEIVSEEQLLELALFHYDFHHVESAERILRRLAVSGNVAAMINLARLVVWHHGGESSEREAEEWYRCAALTGDVHAMYMLGLRIEIDNRPDEAKRWYRRAAEAGHLDAMTRNGQYLVESGQYDEAEMWYRRAAESENSDDLYGGLLGRSSKKRTLAGFLETRGRRVEAEEWYRRAAEVGDLYAAWHLSWAVDQAQLDGTGIYSPSERREIYALVARSEKLSKERLREAATSGNRLAMNEWGETLKRDRKPYLAVRWFRRAAELGYVDAMCNLGRSLAKSGSFDEAEAWYRKAASTGDYEAMRYLGLLLIERNDAEQGETWLRRAARPWVEGSIEDLACFLEETGRFEEAEEWRDRDDEFWDT
jgi:TPR repeat protein